MYLIAQQYACLHHLGLRLVVKSTFLLNGLCANISKQVCSKNIAHSSLSVRVIVNEASPSAISFSSQPLKFLRCCKYESDFKSLGKLHSIVQTAISFAAAKGMWIRAWYFPCLLLSESEHPVESVETLEQMSSRILFKIASWQAAKSSFRVKSWIF